MNLAPSPARPAGGLEDCSYATDSSSEVATITIARSQPPAACGWRRTPSITCASTTTAWPSVQVGNLFFYVNEDGRTAPVAGVDGHAVGFNNDLAPSPRRVGGDGYKIGYIDKHLALAIPARWDGGLDFSGGRAEVCRGCHVARDGDFAELQGGLWGCIDTDGHEVVPVNQPSPDGLDCAGQ